MQGSVYNFLNGTVVPVETTVRHGVIMTLSCDEAYQLTDGDDQFTCNKGTWNPALSQCEEGMFIGIALD